jgi:hypothetical protein
MGDALPALELEAGRTVRQAAIASLHGFGLLDDGQPLAG